MRKNKMQFFSILFLALLGVLVYAGISAMGHGLYVSSDSIYPDFKGMGYAYCSSKSLENIDVEFEISYTNLVVTSSCEDKDKFEQSIDKTLGGGYAIVIGRPDNKSHNMVEGEFAKVAW